MGFKVRLFFLARGIQRVVSQAVIHYKVALPVAHLLLLHTNRNFVVSFFQEIVGGGTIVIDEAQDLDKTTVAILNQVKTENQFVLVGDTFQQINEWNGAVNMMEDFKEVGESVCCTLSTTFRFGPSVCTLRNTLMNLHRHVFKSPIIEVVPHSSCGTTKIETWSGGLETIRPCSCVVLYRTNVQMYEAMVVNF